MNKTKIDWADSTWNPVTGCLHGCEYCYARGIARRFEGFEVRCGGENVPDEMKRNGRNSIWNSTHGERLHVFDTQPQKRTKGGCFTKAPYPYGFDPTFHRYRLEQPRRWTKPRNIFVCSMADLFGEWVSDSWIQEVFAACEAAPQHRYLFLTKNPKRLCNMATAHSIRKWNAKHPDRPAKETEEFQNITPLPVHDNWWFGSTLDNAQALRFQGGFTWHSFTSIEPIMEFMNMGLGSFGDDEWTIIGAETGTRKGKIVPKREWVENILDAASITGVKVFMKESLRELMGPDFRQEFPWEV